LNNLLQNLPDFKGKRRLVKLLFNKRVKTAEDVVVQGRYKCKYLIPNLQENVGFDIFVNGIYEAETIAFLQKIIPEKGVYMDLGANIGTILIPLCKLRSDIRAIGVEAAPWIYKYLEHNAALNQLNNVQLINKALFDKDDMSLDFYSPHDKYGKGSLSPVFSKEGVKVWTKKVDTLVKEFLLPAVDVIKIDVEGFEYFVFKGAHELLSNSQAPDIIFEFVDWAETRAMGLSPGAAQQLLLDLGYELFTLEKGKPVKLDTVLRSGSINLFASKKATYRK
jgi:FkbM family methyltransferase